MENQISYWIILLFLKLSLMIYIAECLSASCPSPVNGQYGESLKLSCDFPPDPVGVYWFEEHDMRVPVIRLQNGRRTGKGLDSGEYNITDNGELLIIDADFSHEQKFHVYVIDKTFTERSSDITVKIIQGCQSNDAVIGRRTIIGCSIKPGSLGIYWFDENDKVDPFIRLQVDARYGRGFDSGAYNITNNGSLVINHVSSAHNYSIYVINGDGSDATFYAQLTMTDEQSASTEPNEISHQTEIDPHGSTTPIGKVSSTVRVPNTTTDESEHNRIPTEKIVPKHTTDVRNEIGKLITENNTNDKPMFLIAVCVPLILIIVTIIIILMLVIRLRLQSQRKSSGKNNSDVCTTINGVKSHEIKPNGIHNNREIPRGGVQV